MYVWVTTFVPDTMDEPDGVDLNKVAAGTLLLAVSPAILVATGHLNSPIPLVALAALPAGIVAALWIRTEQGSTV
jgi:hypothetical protein